MIELSDQEQQLLRLEQRHRRNKKHYVKITTVLMLDSGFSAEATATALGIDQATVYRYAKLYERSASLEEYLHVHYRGSEPLLNDEQIEILNTASTIALFERLEEHHPEGRIHVICDNAAYYHSHDLRQWLKEQNSRIRITFLPPYSPNLNLIERLWKYLRGEALDTTYYATYEAFTSAIFSFFVNIKEHLHKLKSLLALNFHIAHDFAF